MKLSCDALSLSEAINRVIKAISVKKTNTILECIKLTAVGSVLILTATDMELTIEKKIVADIQIEGSILVPGRFFADFIKKLTNEQIILECADGERLTIKYSESSGYINCFDVNDFPNVGEVGEKYLLCLPSKDMRDVINKTIFAASTEDTRQVLKGCLFEVKNDKLTVVALDGYRLSLCKKEVTSCNVNEFSCIIPARSLTEISKIIENDDRAVNFQIDGEKLLVEIDNTVIISRLIKGDYINYRNIISNDFSAIVTFSRAQFTESISRVSLISRLSKNNLIKIEIKESFITIDSNSEMGNIHETLPARVEGKDNVICFNGKYLQDFLDVIDDEFIKMNVKASSAPCIFTQTERDDYLFLILPMRITG